MYLKIEIKIGKKVQKNLMNRVISEKKTEVY